MSVKPVILGVISIAAVAAVAGCGGSATATPTPSSSGLTLPVIPGLPTLPGTTGGSGGSGSAAANTLLSASDVATISGDPNVAEVGGTCSAATCVYADTASTGGGGGVIVVEPFPGGLGQAALQAALDGALSAGGYRLEWRHHHGCLRARLGCDQGDRRQLRDLRILEGQLPGRDQRHVDDQHRRGDGLAGAGRGPDGGGKDLTAQELFELGHHETVILELRKP